MMIVACAVLAFTAGPSLPVAAQNSATLDLVAQTTWVGAEPAVIDVLLTDAPDGFRLRAAIHEATTTREELLASISGDPTTTQIASWEIDEPDQARVGGSDIISIVVPDEEVGELLRRPSDAGPHPVHIELVSSSGRILDTLRTNLLVLPQDSVESLAVAMVFDLRVPFSRSTDQTINLDAEALANRVAIADTLAARAELPLTVEFSPETFDSLSLRGDTISIDALRSAAAGNEVFIAPWAPIDSSSWIAANRADVVVDSYDQAAAALASVDIDATGPARFDVRLTAEAVGVLASGPIGVTSFMQPGDAALETAPTPRPGFVRDDKGTVLPVAITDPFVESLLKLPDPEVAAHTSLAELLRIAMDDDDPRGIVILATELDTNTLDLVLDGLDADTPLQPATVSGVLSRMTPLQPVALPATASTDYSAHADRRADAERRLDSYEGLIASNLSITPPLRELLAVSVSSEFTDQERDALLDIVLIALEDGMAGIELVERGRISITERSAELPITIVNGQSLPITVAVELDAEKISFPEGDRQLETLDPGENEVLISIEARASGDSLINVRLTTPDGSIELSRGSARVRSTAISGLGLLISVVALAVLVGWWARTTRERHRPRSEAAATVAPPVTSSTESTTEHTREITRENTRENSKEES